LPRILLLHASVGTGHLRAAKALEAAFTRKQDAEVRVEDSLDYSNPLFRQAYAGSYLDMSQRAPLLWRLFYESTNTSDPEWIELTNRLRSLVEGLGVTSLDQLVRKFAPAAIVCTHFLPVELLLRLKNQGRLPQPLYCVVTDFFPHSFWITPGIDGYFVASDLTRDVLVARGISPSIIHVSGIPIDTTIAEPKGRDEMRARHRFPIDGPLVTLFGGGLDSERVRLMVEGMLSSDSRGTLAVVAGRNETLMAALDRLDDGPGLRLRKLGLIDYVDDLVAASDLVVTKAGGLIVSEVLARGAPMVLVDPIPGQEEWNADYVVSAGAGIQLRMAEMVPRAVRLLLEHPQRLDALRGRAQAAGRPRAALDIAERVLHDLSAGVHA
jgi:processive 1,2-diacylglycerol beta-glucosyltransferase